MKLSLFDLHCDTATEMFDRQQSFSKNTLAVSLENAKKYAKYSQIVAIWSNSDLGDDEAYERFFKVYDYFQEDAKKSFIDPTRSYIFAVEDARILGNDISRLDRIASLGVKILTLTWSGSSCIGGAYNTELPLTEFGEAVVRRCLDLNIVPDISHASRQVSRRVFEINEKKRPVIASHSDSFKIHPHPRNLTDQEFLNIVECSGLVGINLYCTHLGIDPQSPNATDKVVEHIEHYLSLGGESTVCFGCDFDGAKTPDELKTVSDLYRIADRMLSKGYSENTVHKIFWQNAEDFINKNFRKNNSGR